MTSTGSSPLVDQGSKGGDHQLPAVQQVPTELGGKPPSGRRSSSRQELGRTHRLAPHLYRPSSHGRHSWLVKCGTCPAPSAHEGGESPEDVVPPAGPSSHAPPLCCSHSCWRQFQRGRLNGPRTKRHEALEMPICTCSPRASVRHAGWTLLSLTIICFSYYGLLLKNF